MFLPTLGDLILALVNATAGMCQTGGKDPADAIMLLITAGVLVASTAAEKPAKQMADALADARGNAIVLVDSWYPT